MDPIYCGSLMIQTNLSKTWSAVYTERVRPAAAEMILTPHSNLQLYQFR